MTEIKVTTQQSFLPPKMVIFKLKVNQNVYIGRNYKKKLFTYSGYEEIVDLLIENGADVNSRNNNNESVLIFAAGKGNSQIEKSKADQKLCIAILNKYLFMQVSKKRLDR